MLRENIINPFFIGRYAGAKYFCDREKDTETLVKHIINGRNVALISPRRLGKSGLIHHMFSQRLIEENYITIYVDIYSTSNLCEFAKTLSEGIVKAIRSQQKWHEKFFEFITSLRVGEIEFPEKTIKELFEYLETLDKPCVLAIDEFQQIREYPENTAEAFIRTLVQQCSRTSFIFCGSKRHMMTDIFYSPAKPFFQSVISQSLHPIPMNTYIEFA
jgi:AAA+ ATPase superfamily predicted ATPase